MRDIDLSKDGVPVVGDPDSYMRMEIHRGVEGTKRHRIEELTGCHPLGPESSSTSL
jgi:hypothetical protein